MKKIGRKCKKGSLSPVIAREAKQSSFHSTGDPGFTMMTEDILRLSCQALPSSRRRRRAKDERQVLNGGQMVSVQNTFDFPSNLVG